MQYFRLCCIFAFHKTFAMRVIDNSPIDQPTIGRLITMTDAIGSLADCCLYLLPNSEELTSDVEQTMAFITSAESDGAYFNEYDYEALEDMDAFMGSNDLLGAIHGDNANLVMPLKTPHLSSKQYLIAKADKNDIITQVSLMIYTSERTTKHGYGEVLRQYAADDPDGFCNTLETQFENRGLWDKVTQCLAATFSSLAFGGVMGIVPPSGDVAIPRTISFRKKTEMLEGMKESIKKFKKNKDPRAAAELTYLLDNLDKESLLAILSALPKQQLETFYKTANPRILAEKSRMKLDVRHVGQLDNKFKTNGYYRLFLTKDMDQIQVHFKYKESFVVYLIYLIDKLKREEVDSLSIKDYKNQFLSLYMASYNDCQDEVLVRFNELFRNIDKKGDLRQAQLKHCYSDIRSSLSTACSKIDELPAPYILQNYHDHLFALKENINVDDALINLFDSSCK